MAYKQKLSERYWTMNRTSFSRVNNELQVKGPPKYEGKGMPQRQLHGFGSRSVSSSPKASRGRSCSPAVSRAPPDSNRYPNKDYPKQYFQRRQRSCSPEYSRSCSSTPKKSSKSQRNSPTAGELSRSRGRTSSMPSVSSRHAPMLAQTKRCEPGVEYYRIRSFSITPNGVFNLGDSFKARSQSQCSVNSAASNQTDPDAYKDHAPSGRSQSGGAVSGENAVVPTYRVAMLGASGVGKTTLSYQFMTSEFSCGYDTSLDEEFGQKTVSVMLDGEETELEIIDHPSAEMTIETFCSTYNPDICVVVYSIDDVRSVRIAEDMIMYLWNSDYMSSIGVILVANKADLERRRVISTSDGKKLADDCRCKFIETSSGIDHNVDELLVGILTQVSLNPMRRRYHILKKRSRLERGKKFLKFLFGFIRKTRSCENLFEL